MEMNESSRWTEEEMETAKKGKAPWWRAVRLRVSQVARGAPACVPGSGMPGLAELLPPTAGREQGLLRASVGPA